MLGKLGDLLNKDMGALVKDAGKVLNTDVGAIAKGAGKVLNTDVGDIAKGAGKVLNTDLGDLLRDAEPAAATADEAGAVAKAAPPPQTKPRPPAEAKARPAAAAPAPAARPAPAAAPVSKAPAAFDAEATQKLNPSMQSAAATVAAAAAFDADSTQKLNPADEATQAMAAGSGQSPSDLPQIAVELVTRNIRAMPEGTSLLVLLPHSVGDFVRPHATPVGELTSDPVSAMYSFSGNPVAVRLMQCWDEDEARDRLKEIKVQSGSNFRMADDGSWILGATLQGLTFAWSRGNYSFTAIAPKGEVSLAKFLNAFPY